MIINSGIGFLVSCRRWLFWSKKKERNIEDAILRAVPEFKIQKLSKV
jgi:hypothetical protein